MKFSFLACCVLLLSFVGVGIDAFADDSSTMIEYKTQLCNSMLELENSLEVEVDLANSLRSEYAVVCEGEALSIVSIEEAFRLVSKFKMELFKLGQKFYDDGDVEKTRKVENFLFFISLYAAKYDL